MSPDFQNIARLAIAQCQTYEKLIAVLKELLSIKKTASAVDTELVKKSVDALIKQGSLKQEQALLTEKLLSTDPNAALRALTALCEGATDAKRIVKTLSVNLDGGVIVSSKAVKSQPAVDNKTEALTKVALVLGLNLK